MKKIFRYAILAALPALCLWPLAAQDKNEPGITRQQADDILNELKQIRQLLEKQAHPAAPEPAKPVNAKLDLHDAPMIGNKDAPITMVEFTDFQCPFCKRFHDMTFGELKKNYIDTGKVRFYSRDFPLESLHANANRAAEAGRCAADQGQFWPLRYIMSAHPEQLDLDSLVKAAADLKLNVNDFRTCVESEKHKADIQTDVLEAMKIGADGTPAFIIGKSTPEGVDGELVVGAQPYPVFDSKLKELTR